MPGIRYTEVYEQGTGVLIDTYPVEISDEVLQREADEAELAALLHDSPPVGGLPELWRIVRLLANLTHPVYPLQ